MIINNIFILDDTISGVITMCIKIKTDILVLYLIMILLCISIFNLQMIRAALPCGCEGSEDTEKQVNTVTSNDNNGPSGNLRIVINTYKRTLTLYNDGEIYKTYSVAVGKPSTKTPIGEWAIIRKAKDWGGGFGTRWFSLNVPWGIYGIHGTNKPWTIGTAASHGCIRMYNRDVEELYQWVPVKTRVKIIGKRKPINVNQTLRPGQTGLEVMQLQDNLKKYGFEPEYMDARYGPTTKNSVMEVEAQFNLKVDGITDWNLLYILDLPGE